MLFYIALLNKSSLNQGELLWAAGFTTAVGRLRNTAAPRAQALFGRHDLQT